MASGLAASLAPGAAPAGAGEVAALRAEQKEMGARLDRMAASMEEMQAVLKGTLSEMQGMVKAAMTAPAEEVGWKSRAEAPAAGPAKGKAKVVLTA